MTPDQLLALPPAELAAMTDEQLSVHLAPLIPLVRMEYAGKAESTIVLAPGKKTSDAAMKRKLKLLFDYVNATKAAAITNPQASPD